ncbi:hypothetical protein EI94DRAFT_1790796 [Lactarius quietus]|nr:hypothetical protein EI94DRAFT_1790796 [Lactarius quietus]
MPGSAVVDIQKSCGAAFVGLLINHLLFGLEIVQACKYYSTYWNRDQRAFKIFVAFLLVVDTLSTSMCAYGVYWHLILNFGNLESVESRVWATNLQPLFSAIPSFAVQLYYVRRTYLVSQSIICPIVVVPLILGGTFFSLYFTIKVIILGNKVHVATWLPCLSMGTTVFADIVITGTMCWTLYHKRTGFARTDSMITTLIVNTINSVLLLTTLGIAMIINYAVGPTNMIWEALFWVASKCYINSLLAMLNTRDHIRGRLATDNDLSLVRFKPPGEAYDSQSKRPGVAVTVHRSTASNSDFQDQIRPQARAEFGDQNRGVREWGVILILIRLIREIFV